MSKYSEFCFLFLGELGQGKFEVNDVAKRGLRDPGKTLHFDNSERETLVLNDCSCIQFYFIIGFRRK